MKKAKSELTDWSRLNIIDPIWVK